MNPLPAAPREEFLRLLREQRARCLWFLREEYVPETPEEIERVLGYLQRNGDRETYLAARRVSQWLSQDSSASSASS